MLTRHDPPASVGAWSLKLISSTSVWLNPKPGKYSKNETNTPTLRIVSWNVKTISTGLTEDLKAIDDVRKTAIKDSELLSLNVDIAALQETRLPDSGSLKEENYTFFWQGKRCEEASEHGVGFSVKNTLLCMIQVPSNGTARILTLRLSTAEGTVHLVCVYAPTLQSPPEVKDQLYESL